jgi:predicted nucleic acid-binding Zn ribbon protein
VPEGTSEGTSDGTDPPADDEGADAVRSALGRARAAAKAKGLVAGRRTSAPRRRVAGTPRSGSGPDGRDPQRFAASISRLVTERGWQTPVAVGGVIGRWDQVVGAEVAAHCVPESFDESVLVVRTDSTAWATQMRMLAPTVLRRLTEELGSGVVQRLVVRGPSGPSWRRGPRSASGGRGPRDTYG